MTIDEGMPDRQLRQEIRESGFLPNKEQDQFTVMVTQSASTRTWSIMAHRKMSIHDLMVAVEEKTGINMSRRWLIHGGKALRQMSSLAQYPEIRDQTSILINDRMQGGKKQ
jgi:hypothetical protein